MNRKWLYYIFSVIFLATAIAGFAMYKLVQVDVESVGEERAQIPEAPPKTATEILSAELAGESEAFPKATPEDLKRPPAESRTGQSLEDEFDSLAPDRDEETAATEQEDKEAKPESKPAKKSEPKKSARSIASVPKHIHHVFKVESSKAVLSKNIDRKKALAQLRKDFSRDDCSADTGKNKSLKATVQFGKDGSVGQVKISPSTGGDKDLVKCLKKKLTAKAKAYKSKDKSGGKLTLSLKVK